MVLTPLEQKKQTIDGLMVAIAVGSERLINTDDRYRIEFLEKDLTAKLATLMDEFKLREADTKIESMRKVVAILQN